MPTKVEKDAITGTQTTGHEWDGVKELDTPLPRWWLWTFYATVIWAIGYWIVYPAWPGLRDYTRGVLGWSQYQSLSQQMESAAKAKAQYVDAIAAASLDRILADKSLLDFSIAGGRTAFADNCTPCHSTGGGGAKAYPNLADNDWLWGGTLEDIYTTVRFGVRSGHELARGTDMPRFGADGILTPEQISDVALYVRSLSGAAGDAEAMSRGGRLFAENCVACHGEGGEGIAELGAPRLNVDIWLYGGDQATVEETVAKSRRGVMPAWTDRLSDTSIKMLVVYVHSLGGGQ